MSLVNDALKRARAETQERQARQSGIPLPPAAPERLGASRGAKLLPILALLGVVFLVGLLAGAITFVRNRAVNTVASTPEPVSEPRPVEAPARATPSNGPVGTSTSTPAAPAPRVREKVPSNPAPSRNDLSRVKASAPPQREPAPRVERPRAAAKAPENAPATAAAAPSATSGTPAPRTATRPAPAPAPKQATKTTASTSSASAAQADEDSLPGERDATSANGRQLALGGIAWSETGPFALINGRVLAAGERVEGFKVIDIQKEKVELEDGDERIVLRLR